MRFEWNNRSLHDLVKLRNQGYTFEEIAEELSLSYGKDVSRNAVSKRYRKLKEQQDELDEEVDVINKVEETEDVKSIVASVVGILASSSGKIRVPDVKKELQTLGKDENYINKEYLVQLQKDIQEDADIKASYDSGYNGGVTLQSLRKEYGTKQTYNTPIHDPLAHKHKDTQEIDGKTGVHKSTKLIEINEDESKDPDYILYAHGYDPLEFELVSSHQSKWNQHNKEDGTVTLYSSKISVKPRKEELHLDTMKSFFTEFANNYTLPKHVPISYEENGNMLEVNICDVHLDKLATVLNSNDTYNMDVARERFFYVINDILTKVQGQTFEKVLFVQGNDFFNYDTMAKTTTRGTPQDTHSSIQEMFKTGLAMLIEAIDLFAQVAPVETKLVGGNHDAITSYFASEALYAWYRDNENVEVDVDPKSRKYVKFGKCLLQLSHGNAEKKRLGKTMQAEVPKWWGDTLYREVHAGHLHSQKGVEEEQGVTIRHLSSISGSDTWHNESGYVGALQQSQTFIWNKDRGVENIIHTTIPRDM